MAEMFGKPRSPARSATLFGGINGQENAHE